jgi:hypothetical protein
MAIPQLNLMLAWVGTLLGFLSGLYLGLNFHRDDWLGGYNSFKRRLYRLGHISFFGLAAVNFMFYFTIRSLAATGPLVSLAAWGFIIGAISMPICCVVMAHSRRTQALFGIPVLSLITGATLTVLLAAGLTRSIRNADFQSAVSPIFNRQARQNPVVPPRTFPIAENSPTNH